MEKSYCLHPQYCRWQVTEFASEVVVKQGCTNFLESSRKLKLSKLFHHDRFKSGLQKVLKNQVPTLKF
jgi:hypothetical protein